MIVGRPPLRRASIPAGSATGRRSACRSPTERSEFSNIFGSVPTALTGVSHSALRQTASPRGNFRNIAANSTRPLSTRSLIKGERPGRRLQRCDLLLERLQIGEVHRVVAEIEVRRQQLLSRSEIGEHAEHLAGVAADRVDVEPVGNAAVPLRPVLPRRVPQEGIADRRVRDLDVGDRCRDPCRRHG